MIYTMMYALMVQIQISLAFASQITTVVKGIPVMQFAAVPYQNGRIASKIPTEVIIVQHVGVLLISY